MSYILKNTSSLLNTKITDAARKKISEGKFNVSYFQIGDSEISYENNETDGNVLSPSYNAQNLHPNNTNKSSIKYPILLGNNSENSFGIPFNNSYIEMVENTVTPVGFFYDDGSKTFKFVKEDSNHLISSDYTISMNQIDGTNQITVTQINNSEIIQGSVLVFYFDNITEINQNIKVLFFRAEEVSGGVITLDRNLPDYSSSGGTVKIHVHPSGIIPFYDSSDPQIYWNPSTLTFEGLCDVSQDYVRMWNMNIPWTELPAGFRSSENSDNVGSTGYTGTKEYLGYNSSNGQVTNDDTFYYNSLKDKIIVSPEEQKSIAILHYTNNTIDNFYGEKLAKNTKVHLPWLMWHKSSDGTIGETFYVKPPYLEDVVENYITSGVNSNMNEPGIRYYHLWDSNETNPSRVGKVFPDLKIIVIDDEEIVAAMSYKSNRNWTLPAPRLGLIVPNTFNGTESSDNGILDTPDETLWVTYRIDSPNHKSLHCNYYSKISGTDTDCPPDTANVTIKFGEEFPFLNDGSSLLGFTGNQMILLVQKVEGGGRPNPTAWRKIDVTSQINGGSVTEQNIKNTTFQVTLDTYNSASTYNLNDYISLPVDDEDFNFGDEYFFYGTIETDINATIYVMNYLCNLSSNQFLTSTNPTWSEGNDIYVTEVGLYDDEKDLMIISKLQSPQKRIGVQQYSIKLDI